MIDMGTVHVAAVNIKLAVASGLRIDIEIRCAFKIVISSFFHPDDILLVILSENIIELPGFMCTKILLNTA